MTATTATTLPVAETAPPKPTPAPSLAAVQACAARLREVLDECDVLSELLEHASAADQCAAVEQWRQVLRSHLSAAAGRVSEATGQRPSWWTHGSDDELHRNVEGFAGKCERALATIRLRYNDARHDEVNVAMSILESNASIVALPGVRYVCLLRRARSVLRPRVVRSPAASTHASPRVLCTVPF